MAGARVTHYADTVGAVTAGGYTRTLGEVGFDTALRASGTFDYQNAQWDINGLRHLFTPRLSYRYIPEADRGRARIPQIDRQTFSTYLPPLGLGETRNIDALRATNTLRLAFDNTLQTRDATYGSRDLLTLNVATDFRFKRAPGERDVSVVQTEAAFAPAHWLQVDAFSQLIPQTAKVQEFNSGVTLHDGNAWSLRFSNNFLRGEIQDYHIDGQARLNERFDALARLSYDARTRRFNEQAYGLVQNLDHAWRVSYVVSVYSGPRRESHFGLNVQIEALGF
jgi:LPS-assembly protein